MNSAICLSQMKLCLALAINLFLSIGGSIEQQDKATLHGRVVDQLGGLIVSAQVSISNTSGFEKTVVTTTEGRFVFSNLAFGQYTLRVKVKGFEPYEDATIHLSAGRNELPDITLSVAVEKQTVTVNENRELSVDSGQNGGGITLRGSDLEFLPDDPESLAMALQALAGPTAGPDGGQLLVDGFSAGRVPPRESIREVRINRNQFSAEFDKLGFGRIEVSTKPGASQTHAQAFFSFNDESLNSRNPFAPTRAAYQDRRYGGNLSGPFFSKKAVFFVDLERRETDDNAVINATVLDSAHNFARLNQVVLTPVDRTAVAPRFDYQINQTNQLSLRYSYINSGSQIAGVGGFDLLSRAYHWSTTEQIVQVAETAILNKRAINEIRGQYLSLRATQESANAASALLVLDAFSSGGAQLGRSFVNEDRFEIQNNTSYSAGKHMIRAGARLRYVHVTNVSPQNFGGTFIFAGRVAPQLNAGGEIVRGDDGEIVFVPITSIESYRRTILFQGQGLPPGEVRALGGGVTQLSFAAGDPRAEVSQLDLGTFLEAEWQLRPNLQVNGGLRYETQNNISKQLNFAPRVSLAWAPHSNNKGQAGTIIRAGFGIFYDRFSENLTLLARRFNGTTMQRLIVSDPAVLDTIGFDPSGAQNLPPVDLASLSASQTVTRVARDLHSPYALQTAVTVERALPHNTVLSVAYLYMRGLHLLRTRNINAPIVSAPGVEADDARPFGPVGNIYLYESSGRSNQHQMIVNFNQRLNTKSSLYAFYALGNVRSDTDGVDSFPANQYDLSREYGRSNLDVRHRTVIGGNFTTPWNVRLNPFIIAHSGRPYNIFIGRDLNGDSVFTERPAFDVESGTGSSFDPNRLDTQLLIPRNFGIGPSFVSVNLNLSKSFIFGGRPTTLQSGSTSGRVPAGSDSRNYTLTLSIQSQNVLNRSNLSTPIGNLSSPFFGQSTATANAFGAVNRNPAAGNRRIIAQVRLSF